jgi:hypothetical protein
MLIGKITVDSCTLSAFSLEKPQKMANSVFLTKQQRSNSNFVKRVGLLMRLTGKRGRI